MKRLIAFSLLMFFSNTVFAQGSVFDHLSQALGVGNSFSSLKAGFLDLLLQMQISLAIVLMQLIFVAASISALAAIAEALGYNFLDSVRQGQLVERFDSALDVSGRYVDLDIDLDNSLLPDSYWLNRDRFRSDNDFTDIYVDLDIDLDHSTIEDSDWFKKIKDQEDSKAARDVLTDFDLREIEKFLNSKGIDRPDVGFDEHFVSDLVYDHESKKIRVKYEKFERIEDEDGFSDEIGFHDRHESRTSKSYWRDSELDSQTEHDFPDEDSSHFDDDRYYDDEWKYG